MRRRAVRAVCDREAMASTAIVEIGVSVPHARLDGVAGVIAALGRTPTALYYATAGVPISIMVLVFSAPDLIGEHLNTLASISMLLQSADAAARHRACRRRHGRAAHPARPKRAPAVARQRQIERRRRMGPGGPPGLQNRVVVRKGDGRFDSFPSPPVIKSQLMRRTARAASDGGAKGRLLTDC